MSEPESTRSRALEILQLEVLQLEALKRQGQPSAAPSLAAPLREVTRIASRASREPSRASTACQRKRSNKSSLPGFFTTSERSALKIES